MNAEEEKDDNSDLVIVVTMKDNGRSSGRKLTSLYSEHSIMLE